jgi:hypothetical protein
MYLDTHGKMNVPLEHPQTDGTDRLKMDFLDDRHLGAAAVNDLRDLRVSGCRKSLDSIWFGF